MRRFFFGKGNKDKHKKRLSPTAATEESLATSHPMYQYALNEYAQSVPPASSNDDGRSLYRWEQQQQQEGGDSTYTNLDDVSNNNNAHVITGGPLGNNPHGPVEVDSEHLRDDDRKLPLAFSASSRPYSPPASVATAALPGTRFVDPNNNNLYIPGTAGSMSVDASHRPFSPNGGESVSVSGPPSSTQQQQPSMHYRRQARQPLPRYKATQPAMPDANYEEHYGDAYVGGPIRYIYPSGYQSMRPRGGPWKLSMAVCVSFTWLSVFIIGHCSDRIDDSEPIDDDALAIETRWCGSRMLYLMWVVSMLIMGLSAAYCSVIGYIKVRDFAVANVRSQPPGVAGRSDYYITINDHGVPISASQHGSAGANRRATAPYQTSLYQSDGTPQFWGGHIYRPNQAAMALTSR
jgi:hypothetical protein